MLWEPFWLERRRLPGPERGGLSGEGLDHCAVRERGCVWAVFLDASRRQLVTPAEFLVDLYHLAPEVVRTHIRSHVAEYLHPPILWEDFLDNVGRWAPEFAQRVR